MCIRDPINKTCCKNGKDLSNGAPNIKLWNHTKKMHFPVFAKNFRRPWMKLKNFLATFQILGPLGCQGWVVIPQNVKKVKITAPYWVPWSNEDQPSSTGGTHRTVETHWLILEQWRLSLGYSWSSGGSVRKEPSGISSSNEAYPLPWSQIP